MVFVAVQIRFGFKNKLFKSELIVFPTLKPCSKNVKWTICFKMQITFNITSWSLNIDVMLCFGCHAKCQEAAFPIFKLYLSCEVLLISCLLLIRGPHLLVFKTYLRVFFTFRLWLLPNFSTIVSFAPGLFPPLYCWCSIVLTSCLWEQFWASVNTKLRPI